MSFRNEYQRVYPFRHGFHPEGIRTPTLLRGLVPCVSKLVPSGAMLIHLPNSALLSWVYGPLSVRGFSAVLGVAEVAIALLIAARPLSPRASALGSALAVGMFLTTLSFLVTTPGVWASSAGGFPALSAFPGQALIKDLALLGISLWTLGEAWQVSEQRG